MFLCVCACVLFRLCEDGLPSHVSCAIHVVLSFLTAMNVLQARHGLYIKKITSESVLCQPEQIITMLK